MLTNNQQSIIDNLISEFNTMNDQSQLSGDSLLNSILEGIEETNTIYTEVMNHNKAEYIKGDQYRQQILAIIKPIIDKFDITMSYGIQGCDLKLHLKTEKFGDYYGHDLKVQSDTFEIQLMYKYEKVDKYDKVILIGYKNSYKDDTRPINIDEIVQKFVAWVTDLKKAEAAARLEVANQQNK